MGRKLAAFLVCLCAAITPVFAAAAMAESVQTAESPFVEYTSDASGVRLTVRDAGEVLLLGDPSLCAVALPLEGQYYLRNIKRPRPKPGWGR